MTEIDTIYSQHSSRQFNEDLESLRTELLTMGGLVERQVNDAVKSLLELNSALAQETQLLDQKTNQHERDIDSRCAQIIALRQPTAVDLRLVLSINRAVVDLERIGDEASRVCRQTIELANMNSAPLGLQEVRHIGQLVATMLTDSLTAFARRDMERAYSVVKRDVDVDREYQTAMRTLITFMMEDSRTISGVLNIIWVLRSLERMGDHACNLAEQLIYQVSGEDVRHLEPKEVKRVVRD